MLGFSNIILGQYIGMGYTVRYSAIEKRGRAASCKQIMSWNPLHQGEPEAEIVGGRSG